MNRLEELRKQRETAYGEIQRLRDTMDKEKRDLNAEEEARHKKAFEDFNAATAQIKKLEEAAAADAVMQQRSDYGVVAPPADTRDGGGATTDDGSGHSRKTQERRAAEMVEARDLAIRGWMLNQAGLAIEERHIEAMRRCKLSPSAKSIEFRFSPRAPRTMQEAEALAQPEQRAQSSFDMGLGGALIGSTFISNLERAMLAFGGPRAVAEVMRTSTGDEMAWPMSNDTGNKGRRVGENKPRTTTQVGTDRVVWRSYDYTSDWLLVPFSLLRDSMIPLEPILGEMLGERIARATAEDFTVGDGASKPKGIVTASTLGKETASATAIVADELKHLFHSVDPAYRNNPGVGWGFHDSTLLALSLLKEDTTGNYLWNPGLSGQGYGPTLLGKPYTIIQEMTSTLEAGAKPVIFGDLRKYKIRDVGAVRLRRAEELFANDDQIGFVANSSHDGNLLDAGTHPVRHLLMKAT